MGLIKDLSTKTIDQLAAITDAAYQGDPSGTDANDAYFKTNVHSYLKDLGKAIQPTKIYHVNSLYADLENPYFANPIDAHAQIITDGSSISDKAVIKLQPNGSSYSDVLSLNHNGYVIIKGEDKHACVLSGSITISTGVYIFVNVKFTGNITVTGGVAIFINCTMTSGAFSQSGSTSYVYITKAEHWMTITVTDNDKTLIIKGVDCIKATTGKSIILTAGMTGGTYIISNTDLEGKLDEGVSATVINNVNEDQIPIPTY